MSEFENEEFEGEDTEDEDLAEEYRADQETFNTDDSQDEFFNTYGFKHECHCADDWETGNLGVVSVCFLSMIQDAMEALEELNKAKSGGDAENAQLRVKLVEAGIDPDA